MQQRGTSGQSVNDNSVAFCNVLEHQVSSRMHVSGFCSVRCSFPKKTVDVS